MTWPWLKWRREDAEEVGDAATLIGVSFDNVRANTAKIAKVVQELRAANRGLNEGHRHD